MLLEIGNFGQYLSNLLSSFRWQDILDIVIVGVIIYKICALMSGTRAVKLVIGLFMVLALSLFAYVLNLEALLWIIEKCFSSLLIFVAIIFQPELRRILEEMGRGGSIWHRKKNTKRAENTADELCRALMYCASKKIGALVVLQRETGLKEFSESAIYLNADITYELIVSIFWVNNPLHDGAVILDRNKIISAACYLPLTDETDLTRWFGTRHRAGIGITEVSDAVSLIVSEERGEVSLAQNGRLSTNLKEPQLRRFLTLYFSGEGQEESGVLETIKNKLHQISDSDNSFKETKNVISELSAKAFSWLSSRMFILAISLVVAFTLWGYHASNRNEEIAKTYEVRLEMHNPPAELRAFPSTETVSVTINGERRAVNALENFPLAASVDLKDLDAGVHSLPVHFRTPFRMRSQINPKDIEVKLVRMVDKDLKVAVVPPSDMPDGYILENVTVEPTIVTAHGREDQLAGMEEITISPALIDLQKGGPWKIPVRSPDGTNFSFSPVNITVSADYVKREDNLITVEVATNNSITTQADQSQTQLLTEGSLSANIARGLTAQTLAGNDTIVAESRGLQSSSQASSGLEVRTMVTSQSFEGIPVTVRGAAEGIEWQVEPLAVTVRVDGTFQAIQALTLEALELNAYVDVSNIVAESIPLPLHLQYNSDISGIESVKADISTVKVTRKK